MSDEPVTLYISRQIKPGAKEAMLKWADEVHDACAKFPGFIGSRRLEDHAGAEDQFNVVVRFKSFADLKRWEESEEKTACYAKLPALIENQHISRMSGFEPWFPSPNSHKPPPKWKMWLMAFMAVYPLILITRIFLGPVLHDFPMPLSVFFACIPVSFLMSFVAMPWLSKVFKDWLYPQS
ncbi:antibiotic biosynthesis monooxygenase [Rubellicoccus peritrichatus]|uniref:Antibiotic biosynthesis monooxygenase n=1 Tax=Rubellicoccus peritrichatus TaxID=3080537 RepID=A0AAQ3LID4_9BACT|nr:antibiotic biosynthesis monooxygenase [Puniceicoccus sp. CR14]WOO42634.1 antibiotic biosynthesis monooxygenase [Puniceicoccus sp. CR14]